MIFLAKQKNPINRLKSWSEAEASDKSFKILVQTILAK